MPDKIKPFLTEDFLLQNDFAKTLYHQYAENLPIIDYHCHLSPKDIADNRQFSNLTTLWLEGDHYKWRAMRTLGIDEHYITGKAPHDEKFTKWAATVPYTVRNPLFHWSHLELKRYFDLDDLLTPTSAASIYKTCSEKLATPAYTTRGLITRMKVETICTTDDPCDDLADHQRIKKDNFSTTILPTFRPDKAYSVEDPLRYNAYLDKLSNLTGVEMSSFDGLLRGLEKRINFFQAQGCRLSDHGLENLYYPEATSTLNIDSLFKKIRKGLALDKTEVDYFKYSVLLELGRLYHKNGWVQQYHLGALRNTNARMLRELGPDTGFDSIGDFKQSVTIAKFLNALDNTNQLTITILYNLNPADNEVMGTMVGNFSDGSSKGKMQYGSAWWFLDQKDGMEKQINALSNLGLLSCFVGMLTDSRSFLSYPRHEYFRRILCSIIGKDVENGELPADEKWLGKIVSDICYYNANEYFNFLK